MMLLHYPIHFRKMNSLRTSYIPKSKMKRYGYILCILLAISACNDQDPRSKLQILKGDFNATITESGELLAVNARTIQVPFVGWEYGYRFKITGILDHGTQVSAGDSVVQIDPSNILKFLVEQNTSLETELAKVNKLKVEQATRIMELQANLKEAQAGYNLKKLDLEKFEFESERKKEVKALEFKQATISLERIKRTIELDKKIRENDLKIQNIKVLQIESNITEAERAIQQLTVRSPIEGIFQISKNRRNRQLYRLGDETYLGAQLALVPDLRKIKVKSTINETDIGKVELGQKVMVRLEAFPDRTFRGELTDLGKLSYNKEENSSVKIFDSEIVLDESDPLLKPGMTVSCEIFYAELKNVFYVENSCLKKVGSNFQICVKEKNNWVDRIVEIGPRNNNHTVVYGDLKKGSELRVPESKVIITAAIH